MKILKERFLEAMAKVNIANQIELSRRTGVAAPTISLHLSGKRSVGQRAMEAYGKVLKVNALWLQGKDETFKEILTDVVREQIARYKTSPTRSVPFYFCPMVIKTEDFLKESIQGFMEVNWTKTADLVVKVIGNSMAEVGITDETCVGIKKLTTGQDVEIGKIVLVCLKEKGKEICTLKKYTAKTPKWKIIGIAVDIYKGL